MWQTRHWDLWNNPHVSPYSFLANKNSENFPVPVVFCLRRFPPYGQTYNTLAKYIFNYCRIKYVWFDWPPPFTILDNVFRLARALNIIQECCTNIVGWCFTNVWLVWPGLKITEKISHNSKSCRNQIFRKYQRDGAIGVFPKMACYELGTVTENRFQLRKRLHHLGNMGHEVIVISSFLIFI